MPMTATPDELLEQFITVEDTTRQRILLGMLTQICLTDVEFRNHIRAQYNTAGVTGRRRLCLLFAAVGTPDVLSDLAHLVYPGDEWSSVRRTAVAATLVAGVDKFMPELLFAASNDVDPSVRKAAARALNNEDVVVEPLDTETYQ